MGWSRKGTRGCFRHGGIHLWRYPSMEVSTRGDRKVMEDSAKALSLHFDSRSALPPSGLGPLGATSTDMGVLHPQQALETHKTHTGCSQMHYVHALNLTVQHPSSTGNAGSAPYILGLSGSTLLALPSLPRGDISAWNWHPRAGPLSSTSSEFYCPSQHPSSAKSEVQCQIRGCEPISRVAAPFGRDQRSGNSVAVAWGRGC